MTELVGDLVRAAARRYGERPALLHGARQVSYRELGERAARLANGLLGAGLRPRDRLAAMVEDSVEVIEIQAAAALAGLTLVPVNPRLKAAEVGFVLTDCAAVALVYSTSSAEVAGALPGLADLRLLVAVGAGERGLASARDYESLVAGSSAEGVPPATWSAEDISVIGYTSGTTGFPKGALISHRAIVRCARLVPNVQGLVPYGVGNFPASLSFVSAWWGVVLPHLYVGAALRFGGAREPDEWFAGMAADGCTDTWVPGPLIADVTARIRGNAALLERLQTVVHTGGKADREQLAALAEAVGPRLVETWGMTETVGPLTATTRADLLGACPADDLFASVGRPVATAELEVVGDDGHPLVPGDDREGELVARADTMFSGYLGGDDTAADGGRHRTGDVGRIDAAGYVYVTGRANEMIVSGGMNVHPAEVERVLRTAPGVADCAVFGLPHPRWHETVVAALVPAAPDGLDLEAVRRHVAAHLAGYKKPTRLFVVPELPRTASMKVQRHVLRERFAASPQPWADGPGTPAGQ